jgi:hypothetical protein
MKKKAIIEVRIKEYAMRASNANDSSTPEEIPIDAAAGRAAMTAAVAQTWATPPRIAPRGPAPSPQRPKVQRHRLKQDAIDRIGSADLD